MHDDVGMHQPETPIFLDRRARSTARRQALHPCYASSRATIGQATRSAAQGGTWPLRKLPSLRHLGALERGRSGPRASRPNSGDECDRQERDGHRAERQRISHGDASHEVRQAGLLSKYQREAGEHANPDHGRSSSHDPVSGSSRAERQTNCRIARVARHGVTDEAVEADDGEDERHDRRLREFSFPASSHSDRPWPPALRARSPPPRR